jgi:beta-galactosidase
MNAAQAPPLETWEQDNRAWFSGPDFSLVFDRRRGTIVSYTYKGTRLIELGPQPDFWRAMTDNDIGAYRSIMGRSGDERTSIMQWREAGASWQAGRAEIERLDARSARVTVPGKLTAVGASYTLTYTIYGSGDVIVEGAYQPGNSKLAMMPRFGMEFMLAPGLENITWYGRGPAATYVDRAFERVGVNTSTVDAQWAEYARPQGNSNKVDVRWVALTNKEGVGLLAVGAPTLSVEAYHYTKRDIEDADYTFKLTRRPQVFLNLDLKQMGVGGIDSWSQNAHPLDPYRIPSGQPYSYRYRLSPISGDFAARAAQAF